MYDFDKVTDRSGTYSLKWDIQKGELPMWVADMDLPTAPEITEEIVKRAQHGVFGYTVIPDEWYDAYADWWQTRHNFNINKQRLIFSTGIVPIISSCVRKLTTAAENVVILTPVYNIFFNCIVNNGRNVLQCPLRYENGSYSIDFAALEKCLADTQTTLMIFCNPQNPTGRIWSREELAKVGELAHKHGVTVIADEIHCDITDPDCDYVPYASVSEICEQNCVVCLSPTKAFNIAGLQTAAAYVPNEHLYNKVKRALNTDEVAEPNAFAVQAAVAAFSKGGRWLDELRGYIFQNKQLVSKFLEKELRQTKLVQSQATYLLWLDISKISDNSATFADEVRRRTGLYLSNGAQYGKGGESFLRMNIACPRAFVQDGLERLKRAVQG